jgi:formate dehydrogenase subunit gamma
MNVICYSSQAHLQKYFLIRIVIVVALITWLFPLICLADSHVAQHSAQKSNQTAPVVGANNSELNKTINPRSQVWRKVREGVIGYSAVSGPEAGQLIEPNGEVWRRIRNGPLATYGAWAMLATLAALALFYTFRGQVKLSYERTGSKVLRWTTFERFIHWYTALLFLLLTITGLSILYGRSALIPLLGHESFAVWASWAKLIHNYTGPLFMAGLFTMIVIWLKDNLPDKYDLAWFKAFGGLVGKKHPSAARMNAGEKAWFWMLFWCGMLISLTGLVLDFPIIEQQRFILQITHMIHLGSAILLIIGALAHIYIGTLGTEGALEGMISGEVDEAWAKQHHDLWLEEMIAVKKQQKQGSALKAIDRLRGDITQQSTKQSEP